MVVYLLIDPIDGLVRYVGITKHTAEHRFHIHKKDAKTKRRKGLYLSQKEKWILRLSSKERSPLIKTVYSQLSEDDALSKEQELILKYKQVYQGGTLYNVQNGGEYNSCKASVWNKGVTNCYSEAFLENNRLNQPHRKTVYRFNKNGILIDQWESVRQICKQLKFDRRAVQRCLRNVENFISHKGFMFSYNQIPPTYFNKSTLLTFSNSPHAKKIVGTKGSEIYQFDSIREAADSLGIKAHYISAVLTGRQKTTSGFIWKYSKDVLQNYS